MYCAGIAIVFDSASFVMARMLSNFFACLSFDAGIDRKRSMTPPACASVNALTW